MRQQQRHCDVGAQAAIDLIIPESAHGAETIKLRPALAQPVEVLLAENLQPHLQEWANLRFIEREAQAHRARAITEFHMVRRG